MKATPFEWHRLLEMRDWWGRHTVLIVDDAIATAERRKRPRRWSASWAAPCTLAFLIELEALRADRSLAGVPSALAAISWHPLP
jgi:hypothetical protein